MVMYLRFRQDDADDLVPSLYARRGRRRNSGANQDALPEDTGTPPSGPVPNNGGPAFTT